MYSKYACIFDPNCSLMQIVEDLYDRFSHLLNSLDLVWLDPKIFAAAVHAKGAPLSQCFGFIDDTVRPIARPSENQRVMYSGHKRVDCLKFRAYLMDA